MISPRLIRVLSTTLPSLLLAACPLVVPSARAQIEGFTEPFRSIDLASDESGTIYKLNFSEGQKVGEGDAIAVLDNRAELLKVELATHLADSNGGLDAARKAFEKRQLILERLQTLRAEGNASESELIRAELELSIAEAKYLTAQDDLATRQIELRRSQLELAQRTIRSPFAGIIAKVYRHEGEFLSPIKPEIVRLVDIDSLLAVFSIPTSQVRPLKQGNEIRVDFDDGSSITGTIYLIGVTTDPQSDTVQVKILINNSLDNYRSGQRCFLHL